MSVNRLRRPAYTICPCPIQMLMRAPFPWRRQSYAGRGERTDTWYNGSQSARAKGATGGEGIYIDCTKTYISAKS